MSYLARTRIHFSGLFQADVSTVNNDVRHFNIDTFQPRYQEFETADHKNGWWNPEGTGAFRLINCQITGAVLDGQAVTDDPVLKMFIAGSNDRVCGKMVDLDPQQQAVSELWGLRVRLASDKQANILDSAYVVAPFTNLWRRQLQGGSGDQTLASVYQSVLEDCHWAKDIDSEVLKAMQHASKDGLLSICFNVFGFDGHRESANFTLGKVIGTIGPANANEPKRFCLGRQLVAQLKIGSLTAPEYGIYSLQGQVDADNKTCCFDLGNALPIINAGGKLADIGELQLGLLKSTAQAGEKLTADQVELLGTINYQDLDWYAKTAGIQEFSYADNSWVIDNIDSHPFAVLKCTDDGQYQILVAEASDGLYARSDNYVARLNPGETAHFDFYTTQFGNPASVQLAFRPNNTMIGGSGGNNAPLNPPVPVPKVGIPAETISYDNLQTTGSNGKGTFIIKTAPEGPGNPRGYIDGQVYGIGYQIVGQSKNEPVNPWNFISLLVWDKLEMPENPTWYEDIQPILTQYGNLYPIMSKYLVNLGDYSSVVKHKEILKLAFGLPISDPNYMPATRDMSKARTDMLLKWLDSKGELEHPLVGTPTLRGHILADEAETELTAGQPSFNLGGKTTFINSLKVNTQD